VDEKQAALDGERSTLDQEVAAIRQESAQLQEEKQGLRQQVSEEVLEIYDALLASKHNLAVVKVVEGVCTGCRVELPGKEYDRFLKSEAVFRCSNCRRILVK
jgi:predicted  nucleic acid-binding Zn-ribbon protein